MSKGVRELMESMKLMKWQTLRQRLGIRLPGEMSLKQEHRHLVFHGDPYIPHPDWPLFHANQTVKLALVDMGKNPRRAAYIAGLLYGSGWEEFTLRGDTPEPYRRYHDLGNVLGRAIGLVLWSRTAYKWRRRYARRFDAIRKADYEKAMHEIEAMHEQPEDDGVGND